MSEKNALDVPALTGLFDRAVRVVERRVPGSPSELLPDETHYVRRAVAKRVSEFSAGRACARAAMAQLGFPPAAIPAHEDRSPVWPAGLTGSITHTGGWCAAAVARTEEFLAIGMDSEVVGAPEAELWPVICVGEELAWVRAQPDAERPAAATLLFSVKEAFYKCQYPLTHEWLDFHDLCVDVETLAARGEFVVRGNRRLRIERYFDSGWRGRFVFHDRWVSAGISIAAPRAAQS